MNDPIYMDVSTSMKTVWKSEWWNFMHEKRESEGRVDADIVQGTRIKKKQTQQLRIPLRVWPQH